jgi:hypothetical protein
MNGDTCFSFTLAKHSLQKIPVVRVQPQDTDIVCMTGHPLTPLHRPPSFPESEEGGEVSVAIK